MKATVSNPATDVPMDDGMIVDELLLSIETAESEEGRDRFQKELEELIEGNEEAARAYEAHCLLEKELRALFENPRYRAELEGSPIRMFFRRLRAKIWPGPAG